MHRITDTEQVLSTTVRNDMLKCSLCHYNAGMASAARIGTMIADRRKRLNLSQAELARKSGLPRHSIIRVENGN